MKIVADGCEVLDPTAVWLKYCGTVGKPGGNGENKPQPKNRKTPVYLTQKRHSYVSS